MLRKMMARMADTANRYTIRSNIAYLNRLVARGDVNGEGFRRRRAEVFKALKSRDEMLRQLIYDGEVGEIGAMLDEFLSVVDRAAKLRGDSIDDLRDLGGER